MTTLDQLIKQLAAEINSLSKRSQVALFSTCSQALLPEFRKWAALRGASEDLLDRTLDIAGQFASSGKTVSRAELAALLIALEGTTPPGESPDEISSTFAQDCWICADVCIRVLVDEEYSAGPAIWYAIEPVLSSATEQLFGVSQVGSGEEEERQIQAILDHPAVIAATGFLRWAIDVLREKPTPTEVDLLLIRSRAPMLGPSNASSSGPQPLS